MARGKDYVISITEAAATYAGRTLKEGYDSVTLTVVGLLVSEVVNIEVPRVDNPALSTDAHWTPLVQEGTVVQLSATNNSVTIPVNLYIRLKKAASVGNPFGIRRS